MSEPSAQKEAGLMLRDAEQKGTWGLCGASLSHFQMSGDGVPGWLQTSPPPPAPATPLPSRILGQCSSDPKGCLGWMTPGFARPQQLMGFGNSRLRGGGKVSCGRFFLTPTGRAISGSRLVEACEVVFFPHPWGPCLSLAIFRPHATYRPV